jgi:hypothetical protein
VKIDYQKEITSPVYKFRFVHLAWSGLHIVAASVLIYIIANRFPDGKTESNPFVIAIIGLIVFTVNGISRFFDNAKTGISSASRHLFYKSNRPFFTKLFSGSLLMAAVLSCFLPAPLWKFGLGICGITALFLWMISKMSAQDPKQALKEPVTAVLYTLGIWGSVWFTTDSTGLEKWIPALMFFLLTFQLLIILSHFEALDKNPAANLPRWLGKRRTRQFVYIISILVCMIGMALCFKTEFRYIQRVSLVFVAMSLFQSLIFLKSGQATYRQFLWTCAEFSGLFPLLVI